MAGIASTASASSLGEDELSASQESVEEQSLLSPDGHKGSKPSADDTKKAKPGGDGDVEILRWRWWW
jgi:hypothetical protein